MQDYNKNTIIEVPITYDDMQKLKQVLGRDKSNEISGAEIQAAMLKLLSDYKGMIESE